MNAEDVARAVDPRPLRSGRGWLVRCVVHDDRRASLSLADGENGQILVHCFAGCESRAVLSALRSRGLLPERERWSKQQKRTWAAARRAADAEGLRVAAWWRVREAELEAEKAAAIDVEDFERLEVAAKAHFRAKSTGAVSVLHAYRDEMTRDPEGANRRIAQGLAEIGEAEMIARAVTDALAEGVTEC